MGRACWAGVGSRGGHQLTRRVPEVVRLASRSNRDTLRR